MFTVYQALVKEPKPGKKSALPDRAKISSKHKWKTNHIFRSDKDWQNTCGKLEKLLDRLAKFQGKLGESAQNLLDCLKLRDRIDELIGKVYIYAGLKNDQDTRKAKYQAFRDKASMLLNRIKEENSFFQPEILSISDRKLGSMVKSNQKLESYRHYLEDLRRLKPHTLPKEQEKLLAMSGEIGEGPHHIFSMFNNADIQFPTIIDENNQKIEVTKGRFNRLMQAENRDVRKEAYDALYGTYQNWTNTLAATLSTGIKSNIFYARSRDYETALEAALHHDSIPVTVYHNVIDTINNNLTPLHRYMRLRKKMLGLKQLSPWDLFVPLIRNVKFEVPYRKSMGTIEEALRPLGGKYLTIIKKGFKEGWIDVYENQGKRSGAYSWSTHGVHPFILLNYNNTLDDMFTLTHELGHALHSYYTHNSQPVIYSGYTTFVAEVASTLNESLLINHLMKNTTDPRKRFYLLTEYADQIRGTVYNQALFAEFEKLIHQKAEREEALIASELSLLTRDLYTRYYGSAFTMDSLYEINWCRIPHFYYDFYVYQYVTGFSAAVSISQKILSGDEGARDAYLHFLTRGSSDYSINLLKDAGVNMTSPEPIEETTRLLNELVNQMEVVAGQL